jgi:hypothetical protein
MSSCSSESYQHDHIPAAPDEQELIPTVMPAFVSLRAVSRLETALLDASETPVRILNKSPQAASERASMHQREAI